MTKIEKEYLDPIDKLIKKELKKFHQENLEKWSIFSNYNEILNIMKEALFVLGEHNFSVLSKEEITNWLKIEAEKQGFKISEKQLIKAASILKLEGIGE